MSQRICPSHKHLYSSPNQSLQEARTKDADPCGYFMPELSCGAHSQGAGPRQARARGPHAPHRAQDNRRPALCHLPFSTSQERSFQFQQYFPPTQRKANSPVLSCKTAFYSCAKWQDPKCLYPLQKQTKIPPRSK